jgi:TP901 family phage tail tape measure protein
MADETISTRIVANADFSALIADVHKVTASLSKLQEQLANSNKMLANQIAVMNRSFSDTIRSTGQFSTHFVSLQSDVEKFGKNLDSGKLKLNQYFNTFRDHARTSGGLVRDLAKQQVALQNAILQPLGRNAQGLMQFNVHVPRGLDEVKNKTAIARQELQIMNRVIQDGAGQLINWGKNTQWAGRQLTVGLTVPLAAFGAQAAKAFREADQELVRLTKVYGDVAGTSAAELGKVRDDVVRTSKEISAAMGVSFKETIGLAADIAATGKTGDELLGSIQETTRLAVLGEVDRQEAMKATLAIQSAFKSNTDELAQSINFLNAVENQTSTTLNDLVEAIPKAGPVVKGLGGSVQDLALYMTAMREGGINASEGANALKSALASLINPTDVAVGKFQTLGIDLLGIVNNNAGNLTGTLMALQGALDNLDPLQKQQAIEQLFGKFQFSRLNALFENLGRQGSQTLQVLDLMKASSSDLANVANRELTAVTESASGRYRRALESLKASLAEVGEQFLTINTVLIQVIDKVVQFATNLPKPVKQILALLGGVTAIAGPLIMITGVLANFFGYMAKGIFHLKAFFKGGEGWKYLTPEMLAAEKAGKLVEQSFYSDAKAAAVLKQALGNLIDEFSVLEAKAKSGALSVNPAVSTMAGNLVMAAGGQRVVNPQHPLAGPMGTRASSHMVPRAGMTEQERLAQTMFGMVPGSGMVNQKIGQNPQIYMNDALPNVPGLTSIGGVSTGVVAGEAARWHSMMATLSMQSKAEIEALKKQIVATGVVSKDFMMQFDDILPVVSKLTDNAARESSMIVAELRAGKMTVEAAKAKIIALNLETERMIASAVGTQATAMGRTINPTMVPTLNQPVVDPTGKSNMRELFKKGKTRDFINRVAGALGVRTSGAGYNIETTIPRKMNSGGYVYTMNDGNIVPGPNVNADVVPAMLTPGEFVVNAESTRQNLPLLQAINGSGGNGPGYNDGSRGPVSGGYEVRTSGLSGEEVAKVIPGFKGDPNRVYTLKGTSGLYIGDVTDPAIVNEYGSAAEKKAGKISRQSLNLKMKNGKIPGKVLAAAIKASGSANRGSTEQFLMSLAKNGIISAAEAKQTSNLIYDRYIQRISSAGIMVGDANNDYHTLANRTIQQSLSNNPEVKHLWDQFSQNIGAHTGDTTSKAGKSGASTSALAQTLTTSDGKKIKVGTLEGSKGVTFAHAKAPEPFLARLGRAGLGAFKLGSMLPRGRFTPGAYRGYNRKNAGGMIKMNAGGLVPSANGQKYNMGGMVQGYNEGGEVRSRGTGGMGMFMGGMGLQMGAGMVGGTAGSIMSNVGMAMQFMPMLGMLPKLTTGTKIFSTAIKGLGNAVKAAALAMRAFALANPLLLAGTLAVAGAIAAFKAWRKEVAETKREQTNLFGITEKGAKEAGIKYQSLTEKVKALREEQKLAADKAKAYFESYTTSGVRGLTLTIQQLKELKERVKTDMPELISTFNSIDTGKVNDLAANLKAQMIASGKSVEEATNLIYALIEASDKAGMGVGAISTKAFTGISDQGSAAAFVLQNLAKNIQDVSNIDPSAFAANVDTAIASLDSAVNSLVGTKDASGKVLDESAAIAIQFERMVESGVKNKQLGEETLKTLKSQRPEFANILNKSDTIGGMYAKWRLMLQGVSIDLSKISSAQAETLAAFTTALDTAGEAALKVGGGVAGLEEAAGLLKTLKEQYKNANKAANADSINAAGLSKKQIKAIQDEIKAIRERAEAKKRALRETFDKENAELELQQAKLDLQSAVARGDNEAAAAAQIRIQQIQKEASLKSAEAKIDENARKAEAKQQALLDKDQEYKDKLAEGARAAGNRANNLGETIKTVTDLGNELARVAKLRVLSEAPGATQKQKDDFKIAFSNTLQDIAKAAKSDPKVLEAYGQFLAKDDKGNFSKDAKGNYIPLSANEAKTVSMKRGGGTLNIPQGDALTQLDQLSKGMSTFAQEIIGKQGKTLSDVWAALTKGTPQKSTITFKSDAEMKDVIAKNAGTGSAQYKNPYDKDNYLTEAARNSIIVSKKLIAGDTFTDPNGVQYNVKRGYDSKLGGPRAVRMAMGGYITRAASGVSGMMGSQPYLVGERGPELFVPSSGGQIIPNNILGAKYNIPSNTVSAINSGTNNSYNNNVYNIDIDLNGTNVTADDIMRKFKSELALINAKEGRVRSFGGNY